MSENPILYALLYARGKTMKDNEGIPTKIHMQKEVFILQRRFPFNAYNNLYSFVPLYYGPFSVELSRDLEEGVDKGLISDTDGITLTPAGFKFSQNMWNSMDQNARTVIIQVKEQFNRVKTDDILNYVYDHYPKFTKKSAMLRGPVDDYFDKFWNENNLSDEYFVMAVRKYREQNA